VATITIEFSVFFVMWMLFTATFSAGDVLAGTAAVAIAVIAFEASKRAEALRFRPSVKALSQAWRLPPLILKGTWTLIVELARRASGRPKRSLFLWTPFRAAGADSRSAAKRALAVIFVTLPPNFLIIGFDRKTKLMLFHQIRKDPVPEIVRRLESA
jgi:multisubunit Na+/H+ antiporter MnhE subunit